MLTLLMPSSFTSAQKAEPIKIIKQKEVKKIEGKTHKSNEKSGLSTVFQKLSTMAKNKEKELKKKVEKIKEEDLPPSLYQTPKFPENEAGTEPLSMADIEQSKTHNMNSLLAQEKQPEGSGNSFFNEIVKNIKPVGADDSIDTSKYSSFVNTYNDYHKSKAYSEENIKRQKTTEEE